jgi:serine/threonine protein phosphatase PrpC
MVDDAAIAAVLREAEPEAAVERLIYAALAGGGSGNVSVIVMRNAPDLDDERTVPRARRTLGGPFDPGRGGDHRGGTRHRIRHA